MLGCGAGCCLVVVVDWVEDFVCALVSGALPTMRPPPHSATQNAMRTMIDDLRLAVAVVVVVVVVAECIELVIG